MKENAKRKVALTIVVIASLLLVGCAAKNSSVQDSGVVQEDSNRTKNAVVANQMVATEMTMQNIEVMPVVQVQTTEFIGELGTYTSWDNGYATRLKFSYDNSTGLYYMSFETDVVLNFIDGWEAVYMGDGHTLVIGTYYGNGQRGLMEFDWDTPTTLSVRITGSTGYSDSDPDFNMDGLLNGKNFYLESGSTSSTDVLPFIGVSGYYANGSGYNFGSISVEFIGNVAYIEMQKDDGIYIFQLLAFYIDDHTLLAQWENGTLIQFTWISPGTVQISCDGSTGESELDWMFAYPSYYNSEYFQTS